MLAVPGAHLHLYGKAPRPGRKVGHVTVVAPDPDALAARLAEVERAVGPALRPRHLNERIAARIRAWVVQVT